MQAVLPAAEGSENRRNGAQNHPVFRIAGAAKASTVAAVRSRWKSLHKKSKLLANSMPTTNCRRTPRAGRYGLQPVPT